MAKKKERKPVGPEDHVSWYQDRRYLYEGLGRTVEGLLREFLTSQEIDFLTVTSRAKTVESFRTKIERKQYSNPTIEVTDLCGVRVITYLESDVLRVAEAIREAFTVDDSRSLDKSGELSVNTVGYRSVHFVCGLGVQRADLPEYLPFAGLPFEIQVRTVLQHAWAQIEHDRNYKFGGVLPTPLQRRLFLAAGLLEVADREFDAIAAEIDRHTHDVVQSTAKGELNVELTSEGLFAYLRSRTHDLAIDEVLKDAPNAQKIVIEELRAFGVNKLQDLDDLISLDFLNAVRKHYALKAPSDLGFLREAMLFKDLKRYFDLAWQEHWNLAISESMDLLSERYSSGLVRKVYATHDIAVIRPNGQIEPVEE